MITAEVRLQKTHYLASGRLVDLRDEDANRPGVCWDDVIESVQVRHDLGGRDLDKIGKKSVTISAAEGEALAELLADPTPPRGERLDLSLVDPHASPSHRPRLGAFDLAAVRAGADHKVVLKSEPEKLDVSLSGGRPFESLGSCLSFGDGVSVFFGADDVAADEIVGSPLLNPQGGCTVGCKIYVPPGDHAWINLIQRRIEPAQNAAMLKISRTGAGKLRVLMTDSEGVDRIVDSAVELPTGRWCEIAARWDGSKLQALIDGVMVGSIGMADVLPATGPIVVYAPTTAPDVCVTGLYWASAALDLDLLADRVLRHPRYDELGVYACYYKTLYVSERWAFNDVDQGRAMVRLLIDSSGNDLHGRVWNLGRGLVSSFSGTTDLAGSPRPRVRGIQRAVPLFPLDETHVVYQGHEGTALWSAVEVGAVRLWRSLSRSVSLGRFEGNLFTSDVPISGFEVGQWVLFQGSISNPGPWKITAADRLRIWIEGQFTPETVAAGLSIVTTSPPPIEETVTLESSATTGGAARILAPAGTFEHVRPAQTFTLEDAPYTVALKPTEPYDVLTIIEDFDADAIDLDVTIAFDESIECEIDEGTGRVDFFQPIGHPATATIEVGDPAASAVAETLLAEVGKELDERGRRLLGDAPVGLLVGPDAAPKLAAALGKLGASRGVRIGPRLDDDRWTASFTRTPSAEEITWIDVPTDLLTKIREGTPKEAVATVRVLYAPAGATLGDDDVALGAELREQGDEHLVAEAGSGDEPVFEIETLLADPADAQTLADELLAWLSVERTPRDLDLDVVPGGPIHEFLADLDLLDERTLLRLPSGVRVALGSLSLNNHQLTLKTEDV